IGDGRAVPAPGGPARHPSAEAAPDGDHRSGSRVSGGTRRRRLDGPRPGSTVEAGPRVRAGDVARPGRRPPGAVAASSRPEPQLGPPRSAVVPLEHRSPVLSLPAPEPVRAPPPDAP